VTRHCEGEWLPQPQCYGNLKTPKTSPAEDYREIGQQICFLPLPSRNKFLMSCLTFMKLDTRLCYCTSPRWNILKIYVYSGLSIVVECLRWHNITTHILQDQECYIVWSQLSAYSEYKVIEYRGNQQRGHHVVIVACCRSVLHRLCPICSCLFCPNLHTRTRARAHVRTHARVGESNIIRSVVTCYAGGYSIGWAWCDTHVLLLSYHGGAAVTSIVHLFREFCAINMDAPLFICT